MIRWLVDNLSTLGLAFVLALFVWLVAVQETNPIVEQPYRDPIPVVILNQPSGTVFTDSLGLNLAKIPEYSVEVIVRGPKQTLDALPLDNFAAVVDLADVPLGGADVPVTVISADSLVSIVEQSRDKIFFRLEQFRRVTLPIVPAITGSPALGHVAGEPIIEPAEVTVEGPAPKIDPVDTAHLRLSIEGAQETVQETAFVQLRDANNRLLTGFDTERLQVQVTIPITKSDEYAELFVTVNLTGTISAGYRLADYSVDPQRVTIFGRPEIVSQLPGFVSTFPVDVTGANGDLLRRVGLQVPEGVTLVGPQTVVVEIDIEPVLTTLTIPWRLKILGPGPGLTATISSDVVNVGLIGPLDLIDAFNPETDLNLTLNLLGLEPGSYQLEPTVFSSLPGVEVEGILPGTIQVEITVLPTPTPTPTPDPSASPTVTRGPISPVATPTRTATPQP